MFIKVKEGLVIRDPVTKMIVPPEGLEVHDNLLFWQRRIRDGDVVLTDAVRAPEQVHPDSATKEIV